MQRILEASEDILVHTACDRDRAVESAIRYRPDVALLTEEACSQEGTSLVSQLRSVPEPPQVALLAAPHDNRTLDASIGAGAAGVLQTDISPQNLISAMKLIATGNRVFTPAVVGPVAEHAPYPDDIAESAGRLHSLTARERQVLTLLAQGLTNQEISRRLLLSTATVKDHVSAVYTKLHQSNRVQVAVLAHRTGFLYRKPYAHRSAHTGIEDGYGAGLGLIGA